jgi:hypothetical protein
VAHITGGENIFQIHSTSLRTASGSERYCQLKIQSVTELGGQYRSLPLAVLTSGSELKR